MIAAQSKEQWTYQTTFFLRLQRHTTRWLRACFELLICVRTQLVAMAILSSTQALWSRTLIGAKDQGRISKELLPQATGHDHIHEVLKTRAWNSTSMVRARPPNRALKREKILALAKVNLNIYRWCEFIMFVVYEKPQRQRSVEYFRVWSGRQEGV